MSPGCLEMIDYTQDIVGEAAEFKRTLIIIRPFVTTSVPRHGMEFAAENRQLIVPVGAIATNPV